MKLKRASGSAFAWSLTGLSHGVLSDCHTYKVRRGYPALGLRTSCLVFCFHLMFIGHRQNVLQVPYVVDCATQRFNFGQFLVFRVRRHVFSQSHKTVVDQFHAFSLPRVPSRHHGWFLLLGTGSCPSSASLTQYRWQQREFSWRSQNIRTSFISSLMRVANTRCWDGKSWTFGYILDRHCLSRPLARHNKVLNRASTARSSIYTRKMCWPCARLAPYVCCANSLKRPDARHVK